MMPSVRVTSAMPAASVPVLVAPTEPPVLAVQVTATFSTGLPLASVTLTRSGAGSWAPTLADWWSPLTSSILVGRSELAVPVNATGSTPENTASME